MSYPVIPAHINIYLKSKKGCKDFYNLLNVNDAEPSSKIKWEHEYNICSEIWEDIYTSPFKYKYSSILQWFQIRIIHRILPTKKYLYQIKTIDSPICTNCNQEETLTHLLWTCPTTQEFLQTVQSWLKRNNITVIFIEELFIFNIGKQLTKADLHVILEIKYYIFSAKRLNSPLSIRALHNRLKNNFRVLQYAAVRNNKLTAFNIDWQKYNSLLKY